MKKLIIFDIDGTLLYSNKIDSQCFADTYQQIYNKVFPTIDWAEYPHVSDDTIFKTVIKDHFKRVPDESEMEQFKNAFVHLIQTKRKIRPQDFREVKNSRKTVELLLADSCYEVGIATGGWRQPAMVKLQHIKVPTDTLHMSFADGNPTREAIIQGVFEQTDALKLQFEKIVYVGDAPWDVRTTRNMNLPFVGVRREGDFDKLRKLGADTIIADYSNFDQFLEAIETAEVPRKVLV
ncbi:MAG: HAD hydrolase-like protein [Bacteroidota bacterium]